MPISPLPLVSSNPPQIVKQTKPSDAPLDRGTGRRDATTTLIAPLIAQRREDGNGSRAVCEKAGGTLTVILPTSQLTNGMTFDIGNEKKLNELKATVRENPYSDRAWAELNQFEAANKMVQTLRCNLPQPQQQPLW